LNTLSDSGEEELNFLYPHGPSRSFSYPFRPDVLVISVHDILTIADPKTVTGRMYTLSSDETAAATRAASNHRVTQLFIEQVLQQELNNV